jgi:hypothetical protein
MSPEREREERYGKGERGSNHIGLGGGMGAGGHRQEEVIEVGAPRLSGKPHAKICLCV